MPAHYDTYLRLRTLAPLTHYASLKGLVHSDPPQHTRIRRLVQPAFTKSVVEHLGPRVHEIVDGLLDRVHDQGNMDVVADLARPLPVAVICALLGVPEADQHKFRAWSDQLHPLQGTRRPTLEIALQAQAGYMSLYEYMADLIADRKAHPRGSRASLDVITSLIRGQADAQVNDPDLVTTCITLLSAGFQATSQAIANTVLLLLQHPQQLARLKAAPGLIGGAVDESLRYESPGHTVPRRVAKELQIGETRLREGDLALLVVAAANRDPAQFVDPDEFDITRTNLRHLAFGSGIHLCVGAPLARLEAPIAVAALFGRMHDMQLDGDHVELSDAKPNGRCPVALNVKFATGANALI